MNNRKIAEELLVQRDVTLKLLWRLEFVYIASSIVMPILLFWLRKPEIVIFILLCIKAPITFYLSYRLTQWNKSEAVYGFLVSTCQIESKVWFVHYKIPDILANIDLDIVKDPLVHKMKKIGAKDGIIALCMLIGSGFTWFIISALWVLYYRGFKI